MSLTHPTELDPLVDRFEHLSGRPRANEALQMLKKVASMVKPIMRLRNWRVGVLAEFYPGEQNLLGLNTNHGERIDLRLRYPGDHTQFLPLENIIDTMLHELSHIVHGPHDQAFNALWEKLRDEHEALVRKGYTGEGFLGKGNRLGGRRMPYSEMQRQARAAAERRREHAALSRGSGQKLGGLGIVRGQNAREIIAAAAEKRKIIERGCGSTADTGRKVEATKEKITSTKAGKQEEDEEAMMQAYIDMIQEEESQIFGEGYVPASQSNPWGTANSTGNGKARSLHEQQLQIERELLKKRQEQQPQPQTSTLTSESPLALAASKPSLPPSRDSVQTPPTPYLPQDEETWTCDICTLINPIQYLQCGACETERPSIYSKAPSRPHPTSSTPWSTSNHTYLPNTSRSYSRPAASSTSTSTSTSSASSSSAHHPHPALAPRLTSTAALARIESQAKQKAQAAPVGWECVGCGNWMESMWWTCSACGRMKTSS